LHRTHWPDSPADPGISVQDSDDAVEAEIDAAEKPGAPRFSRLSRFCRIGLVAGKRIEVKTDIPEAKNPTGPHIIRVIFQSCKNGRDFLAKYPHSQKREAAMFVWRARLIRLVPAHPLCRRSCSADRPTRLYRSCPESASGGAVRSQRVMQASDNMTGEFPNGRYAADIRDMRAATFWRMGQWDKALNLTLAQITDNVSGDLLGDAETRLANIFAELANVEHRPQLLEAIRACPACIPYLAAYAGAATNDREHPLRYLQRYLSDQLHFKVPAQPPAEPIAAN
jgi:hypothetical protein